LSDARQPTEAVTEPDEAMIRAVIATHLRVRPYYRPLLLLLGVGSLVVTVLFVRLVLRVQAAAAALDLSFYEGFRFHLILGQPLTARQLDLISSASALRAGFVALVVSVAAPFIVAAIYSLQSLVTKLSMARHQDTKSTD